MHRNLEGSNFDYSVPVSAALASLQTEGLQAPSWHELQGIVDAALRATALFIRAAVRHPLDSEILEFFSDFVVRCVNRGPGVGDAVAD